MRNKRCRTWIMTRKKKTGKMRNKHLEYDEKYRICLYEKYRIYII